MTQLRLHPIWGKERRHEIPCQVCLGDWRFCRLATCPMLRGVREWFESASTIKSTNIFGSSPPAAFIGQWGYPKVYAGPLVPPARGEETMIMDAPELWLEKDFTELLRYRLSMVRGKARLAATSASNAPRILSNLQEAVMAESPLDMELWLDKLPTPRVLFSPREAPVGPSAPVNKIILADNPRVPKAVDTVVGDTDIRTADGVASLYRSGITQRQITRLFSVGLLGAKKERRIVPTEWSITAVDDILGRQLHRKIAHLPEIHEFRLFGHSALANNVQILLLPSEWMFEALESWVSSIDSYPLSDHELSHGRTTYPTNLLGAYHATKLPVLEHLASIGRQAGAVAFLEVHPEWIPFGVFRFREIARAAFKKGFFKTNALRECLEEVSHRLTIPLPRWLKSSRLLAHFQKQTKMESFIP